MSAVRVRFAPSPTGDLHVGNARTALFNWLFARRHQGTFVLRVEDTDLARSDPQMEASLLEELRWLGLDPREGPVQGGPYGPYRQSERMGRYGRAVEELLERDAAYRCFCSEAEIAVVREEARRRGQAFVYPGRCSRLDPAEAARRAREGEAHVVRLRATGRGSVRFEDLVHGPRQVEADTFGDIVLVRTDGTPTYNLAVVVDDAAMEITHVIRGDDHLSNTPKQILLYRGLDLEPPAFAHLPLVTGSDGRPLSKREGGASLAEWRRRGTPAEAVVNALCLLGWGHPEGQEVFSLQEAARHFAPDQVNASPAAFDADKLHWLAGRWMARLGGDELAERAVDLGLLPDSLRDPGARRHDSREACRGWRDRACAFSAEGAHSLREMAERGRLLWDFSSGSAFAAPEVRAVLAEGAAVLQAFEHAARELDLARPEALAELKRALAGETGLKGGALMKPLRAALTGAMEGPELSGFLPLCEEGGRLGLIPGPAERLRAARKAVASDPPRAGKAESDG